MRTTMRMRTNNILFAAILLLLFLVSCNEKSDNKATQRESMTSGEITAYCDNTLTKLFDTLFASYRKAYPDVKLTVNSVSAREAMAKLLAGEARVIIIARDYLRDEDSLMNVYKVAKHNYEEIADDALCFFTQINSSMDTLNSEQIFNVLTDKSKTLKSYFPSLKDEPIFATLEQNSSVFANINKLVVRNKPIQRRLQLFSTVDSLLNFVKTNPNVIGIAYLSHIHRNLDFKPIPVGYTDTTGKYITPKPVHQAYIVQGLYPYIVTYKALFLNNFKDLPFWFAMHLSREASSTKYLKDAGVVPKFARFNLIKED